MKQRDVELLSAFLDGQLSPSESARLEARLKSEPELVSVMDDLRMARGYLRQLPQRRAPRNFTLTRKMVGLNPPMPRAYPAFRFATALATLLFFLTYGLNFLAPQFTAQQAYGVGGGGGADAEAFAVQESAVEAPAATEAPALEAPAPAATVVPPAEPQMAAPAPTMTVEGTPVEDSTRIMETPVAKTGDEVAGNALAQEQPQAPPQEPPETPPLVSSTWQYVLLWIAFLGAVLMTVMRRVSAGRWK